MLSYIYCRCTIGTYFIINILHAYIIPYVHTPYYLIVLMCVYIMPVYTYLIITILHAYIYMLMIILHAYRYMYINIILHAYTIIIILHTYNVHYHHPTCTPLYSPSNMHISCLVSYNNHYSPCRHYIM